MCTIACGMLLFSLFFLIICLSLRGVTTALRSTCHWMTTTGVKKKSFFFFCTVDSGAFFLFEQIYVELWRGWSDAKLDDNTGSRNTNPFRPSSGRFVSVRHCFFFFFFLASWASEKKKTVGNPLLHGLFHADAELCKRTSDKTAPSLSPQNTPLSFFFACLSYPGFG